MRRGRGGRAALSWLPGGRVRGCFGSGVRHAGLRRSRGERSDQVVKILSTAAGGALRARQDVNGRVGVVDTFRILVHDRIASLISCIGVLHTVVVSGVCNAEMPQTF